MKTCQLARGRKQFPITDYFFQSSMDDWHGYSQPYDDEEKSDIRRFNDFSREFLIESSRERSKEMAVFALVVLASAWPVIYMVVTVVSLLSRGRP